MLTFDALSFDNLFTADSTGHSEKSFLSIVRTRVRFFTLEGMEPGPNHTLCLTTWALV